MVLTCSYKTTFFCRQDGGLRGTESPVRNPQCRRPGGLRGTESPVGDYGGQSPLFKTTFLFLYYLYKCQTKPAATNGHSNINAASIANTPKVFHKDSIARGVEPPVNPPAYGTKVCVRAYGASAFKFSFKFSIFISLCRRPGGLRGTPSPKKLKCFNPHK